MDWVRENGRVVREKLACGHWTETAGLAPGQMRRVCRHLECVGRDFDGRLTKAALKRMGQGVRRLERLTR